MSTTCSTSSLAHSAEIIWLQGTIPACANCPHCSTGLADDYSAGRLIFHK
jgi:hypothetical protein